MWVPLLLVKAGKIGLLKEFISSVLCKYSETLEFHDLIKLLPLNVDQLHFQSVPISCLFFNFFLRKRGAIVPAPWGQLRVPNKITDGNPLGVSKLPNSANK